jgi:hypothetical protein
MGIWQRPTRSASLAPRSGDARGHKTQSHHSPATLCTEWVTPRPTAAHIAFEADSSGHFT